MTPDWDEHEGEGGWGGGSLDFLDFVADLDTERVEIVPVDMLDGVVTKDTVAATMAGGSATGDSGGSVGEISSICTSGMGDPLRRQPEYVMS
jgi:hypothetical protein